MTIIDYESCKKALTCIPHKVQVLFAHELALSTLHIFEKEYPNDKRPRNCLDLAFKWIIDSNLVSKEQLLEIAHKTYEASYTISISGRGTALAVNVIYAAANTTFATNNIAINAVHAVYEAANAHIGHIIEPTLYYLNHIAKAWQHVNDTFNQCYRPDLIFDDNWKTSTVVELAKTIFNNNALDHCPVLADALEDAGCTEAKVLDRLRNAAILRSEWIFWNLLELNK